ncbi:MAG: hypothetical protein HRT88_03250 [Lentisphaeraceae bacterium]|nr:hypothetical protein [Lentisphaeraceae bacterium]
MNILKIFLVVSVVSLPCFAQENESPWSFNLEAGVFSKYVFHGVLVNDDPVSQGNASATYSDEDTGDWTAFLWYNLDLYSEVEQAGDFTEVDYAFCWSKSYESLTLGAGYYYYDFPMYEANTSTREIYVSIAGHTFLNPNVIVYYDIGTANGFYATFGLSEDVALPIWESSVSLSAVVGYTGKNYIRAYYSPGEGHGTENRGSLTDATATLKWTVPVTENVSFNAGVSYASLLDRVRNNDLQNNDNFTMFTTISISF